MAFMTGIKVRSALLKQQKGDIDEAMRQYAALYQEGVIQAAYILPYTVLLLRKGGEDNYALVREMLKKAEKAPDMTAERRQQLHLNYAVASWKLGEMDKAISLLEASHRKAPCGNTYGALGFLYVEKGDVDKALAYNLEALDYDDEDPITLDNLAQTYYRLVGDKEKAKVYFEKAHAIKPGQIDTLYFLSRYDLDAGDTKAAIEKLETALEGRFSPLNYVTKEQLESELAQLKSAL